MKALTTILLCALTFSSVGCAGIAQAPVVPPMGFVFTNTRAPMDIDLNNTDLGSKRGTAESVSILGLVSIGDASIYAAAKSNNITTVKHADYEMFNVLGIYSRFTTIVWGD